MINIAICDDEKLFTEELERRINELQMKEKYLIFKYTSAYELEESLINGQKCDILFIDIELDNNIKGTDVVSKLKELYTEMLIVYVSSHTIYYTEMVQADSFRFLTKPVKREAVERVFDAAIKRLKKYEYKYEFGREIYIIDLKEVKYIYSSARKIYFSLINGKETYFYSKLDIVEREIKQITDMFIRINKSYIVNFNQVFKYGMDKIYMKDNTELKISRKYKENINGMYYKSIVEKFEKNSDF